MSRKRSRPNKQSSNKATTEAADCHTPAAVMVSTQKPKESAMEASRPESDPDQKEVALLKRDNDRLQHDNEWLRSESERWSDIVQRLHGPGSRRWWKDPFWLTILTGLTLIVLIWYTV